MPLALPVVFKLDANILIRNLKVPQTDVTDTASLTYYPDFEVAPWTDGISMWSWVGSRSSNESSAFLKISVSLIVLVSRN